MLIADLHIHSKYSRATSRDCDSSHLDQWARRKGIQLVGTGDFTHPGWRAELAETLVPAGDGLYTLRKDCRIGDPAATGAEPRFVVSGEISTIYKKDGKTRKIHSLILLPGLEEAQRLARRLEAIGNLHSDGRPILGLDCRDLLEITLESCPGAVFIPAHIWTPHFSLFGAFSGFDSVEECFGDLTPYIHALETGLSSDPPMNWRVSALDGYHLVSHSDAHSPQKLGREADLLDIAPDYHALARALNTGEGLLGTVEFFPEEGKYHFDGHRNCGTCLAPVEADQLNGICPVCGGRLTTGVLHRVEQLADRPDGAERPVNAKPFQSLAPLPEVIGASLGISPSGVKAVRQYEALLRTLGPEFSILREVPLEDVARTAGPCVAEGLRRLRAGDVARNPGYDGQYGTIQLLDPSEREALNGQVSLFGITVPGTGSRRAASGVSRRKKTVKASPEPAAAELSEAQRAAVQAPAEEDAAVSAGPGTGKTRTLAARAAWLIRNGAVRPEKLAAVTFTNRAAGELRARLEQELGAVRARAVTVGTFHSICLTRTGGPWKLLAPWGGEGLAAELLAEWGSKLPPRRFLEELSRRKNGVPPALELPEELAAAYDARLQEEGWTDFDGLLQAALSDQRERGIFDHLLVDEFQDCSPLQYDLILHWCGDEGRIFAIGDPDQSIYGFRGGSAQCFERLRGDRPGLYGLRLSENYRSTPEILACTRAVLGRGALRAKRSSGPPVRLVQTGGELPQAIWIAQAINRMTGGVDMLEAGRRDVRIEGARSFSDIAVLCRTRRQLALLERCLAREGIPCVVTGQERFLADPEVRRAVEYFQGRTGEPAGDPASQLAAWARAEGLNGHPALERLQNMAVFFGDMDAFLDNLTLGREGDLLRRAGAAYDAGCVTLSTLHGAKGLEFPAVFLCGLDRGVLPLEGADWEEERRLFYVGLTRAEEELILLTSGAASPFLETLPPDVVCTEAEYRPERPQQISLF